MRAILGTSSPSIVSTDFPSADVILHLAPLLPVDEDLDYAAKNQDGEEKKVAEIGREKT